jgi:hypothetical protein
MPDLRITIDTREVKAALQALRKEGPKAIADALNRVGHEIRDAEQIEVAGAFGFASPNTQRFLSRSFRLTPATANDLRIQVYVLPGSRTILERQQFGETVRAGQEEVGPTFGEKLAVPQEQAVKKTTTGRVPVARLPTRLLRRTKKGKTRAYIAGKAVFERIPGQRLGRFLFALTPRARIKPALDFFGVAERTARKELPKKAERVLEKLNLRRGR